MAYVTVADLKSYLGITASSDDALLQSFLDAATAYIESPMGAGRSFQAGSSTRVFDAVRDTDWNPAVYAAFDRSQTPGLAMGRTLYLDDDLCQITSIVNGDGTTITSNQYLTLPRNRAPYYAIQLRLSANIAWAWQADPAAAITVTGVWAYSATPPADIQHACRRLAAWMYRQKDTASDPDRPMVSPDGVTLLPATVPKDVQTILTGYRRYV